MSVCMDVFFVLFICLFESNTLIWCFGTYYFFFLLRVVILLLCEEPLCLTLVHYFNNYAFSRNYKRSTEVQGLCCN